MKTKTTPAPAGKKTAARAPRPRRPAPPETKTPTVRRAYVRRKKVEIPPLLLEGDTTRAAVRQRTRTEIRAGTRGAGATV